MQNPEMPCYSVSFYNVATRIRSQATNLPLSSLQLKMSQTGSIQMSCNVTICLLKEVWPLLDLITKK